MRKKFITFLLLFFCFIPLQLISEEIPPAQAGFQSEVSVNIHFIPLFIGLLIIVIFIIIILMILFKTMRERKNEIIVLKDLDMEERRKDLRDFTPAKILVKRRFSDGGDTYMTFRNRNISKGGVFIITKNLSLFDLGEELDIVIKDGGKNNFKGKALVIHSEVIFNKDSVKTDSGYGVMFLPST